MNFLAAPQSLLTDRLLIRRPSAADGEQIFQNYAADPEVTRYLGWPTHSDSEQSRKFAELAEQYWEQYGVGPYLVFDRVGKRLLGGTGLELDEEDSNSASTGYVFARSAWGLGYATESLRAMLSTARQIRLSSVYALCHPEHRASMHVLEKCGFSRSALLPEHFEFPNLGSGELADVVRYEIAL